MTTLEMPSWLPRVERICKAPARLLHLECDGLTRVLFTLLANEGIEVTPMIGAVTFHNRIFPLHLWLEKDDWRIDYRLRPWVGEGAPEGIFHRDVDGLIYEGEELYMQPFEEGLLRTIMVNFSL